MAILLTGGTGKTSIHIAHSLQAHKVPFLLTSRRAEAAGAPPGMQAIKFDWLDPTTYETPFQHKFENGEGISAVYLISPEVPDPCPAMNAFIDVAVTHGVKRFIMLAGSSMEKGAPFNVGMVWQHLDDIGVEYCVLRATWFMENFSERQHKYTIESEGKIYSACQDGKIPFISASDIAAAAFKLLTAEKAPSATTFRVLGPELLTHDEIAMKLSKLLGREIMNVKLTEEETVQRYLSIHLPEHLAKLLSNLEVQASAGVEERSSNDVETITGRAPQTFDAWIQKNKSAWE